MFLPQSPKLTEVGKTGDGGGLALQGAGVSVRAYVENLIKIRECVISDSLLIRSPAGDISELIANACGGHFPGGLHFVIRQLEVDGGVDAGFHLQTVGESVFIKGEDIISRRSFPHFKEGKNQICQRGKSVVQALLLPAQDELLALPADEMFGTFGFGQVIGRGVLVEEGDGDGAVVIFQDGFHGNAQNFRKALVFLDASVGRFVLHFGDIRLIEPCGLGQLALGLSEVGAQGSDDMHLCFLRVFKIGKQNTVQGVSLHGAEGTTNRRSTCP